MRILLPVFLTAIMAMASAEKSTAMSEPEYTVKGHEKVVVCYWGTWANYRPKDGKFTPEDIDATLCTHLIYSFAGLDAETDAIKPLDPWMDLEEGYALSGYRKATDLKYVYPHLKVKTYSIYSELARKIIYQTFHSYNYLWHLMLVKTIINDPRVIMLCTRFYL